MPTYARLEGKIFGLLTVEEKTNQKEDGYFVWKCRCECGKTTMVNTKKLTRGTVQSCGCVPKKNRRRGAPAEDITGQRYGKLTATKRVASEKGRTRWLCLCECGNEKIVTTEALKRGKVKSCGCIRKEFNGLTYNDLTGKKVGRLIVMEPTDKRDTKGSVIWNCRCDCGAWTKVSADSLMRGNTRSCGCRKKEIQGNIQKNLTFVDNTCIEYLRSRKSRSDNKSGFRGIFRVENKYRVNIGFQNKKYYLGTYNNYEEAVRVRKEAEDKIYKSFLNLYDWWRKEADLDPEWGKDNPFEFHIDIINKEIYVNSPLIGKEEECRLKNI